MRTVGRFCLFLCSLIISIFLLKQKNPIITVAIFQFHKVMQSNLNIMQIICWLLQMEWRVKAVFSTAFPLQITLLLYSKKIGHWHFHTVVCNGYVGMCYNSSTPLFAVKWPQDALKTNPFLSAQTFMPTEAFLCLILTFKVLCGLQCTLQSILLLVAYSTAILHYH